MNKNIKKTILLATIIISIAIIFVPIYFFVLAENFDYLRVINTKIISISDGTSGFDSNDEPGNDSSSTNGRVRNFDSITYTVGYELESKDEQTHSAEGRQVLVEVLIPTTYSAILNYGDQEEKAMNTEMTFGDNNYYYASFTRDASMGENPQVEFTLKNINTSDISQYNLIKPLIFIKESQDGDVRTIAEINALETGDENRILPNEIACESENGCDGVTITGIEDYSISMYAGDRDSENIIPIGLAIGLNSRANKGIKGLIIPSEISFTVTKDSDLLSINGGETSYGPYDNTSFVINEMPSINNGDMTMDNTTGIVTISNINPVLDFETGYFSTNYFLTTLNRPEHNHNTININLGCYKANSEVLASTILVTDVYGYTLGNYISNIEVYSSSTDSQNLLEYGKANINYGSNFALKVNFGYSGGDGITSLTNIVKVDNEVFKLINDTGLYANSYVFSSDNMKLNREDSQLQVLFGFGEWNSNYFAISPNAPSNCPSSISSLTKEELMNLYGGPCLVETNNIKWSYSLTSIEGLNLSEEQENNLLSKGPLLVKSIYVPMDNDQYIESGASGTLELYGTVIDDYTKANSSHQIVTSGGTLTGEENPSYKYFGEEYLVDKNNFIKTNYNFSNRAITALNTNKCGVESCSVSGNTILISAIRVHKPTIQTYKSIDLSKETTRFSYYPIAIKIMSNAIKGDHELKYSHAYIDLRLPNYMIVLDDFDVQNKRIPSSIDQDGNYKIYHYVIDESTGLKVTGELPDDFIIYADIDPISTPNNAEADITTTVDFEASKNIPTIDNGIGTILFRSITSNEDRTQTKQIVLENFAAVVTRALTTPKYIERDSKDVLEENKSYKFNMFAYNHSETVVDGGYSFEDATLYYVLPYNGDLSSSTIGSKIGTSTSFTVKFDSNAGSEYDYYYLTKGISSDIISNEMNPSQGVNNWIRWDNPTQAKSNIIAIKVVKKSTFELNTYFGSESGLTVTVTPNNSVAGNTFYNSFHIIAKTCNDNNSNCSPEIKHYVSSSAVTSVYAREISGFVFEDYDYNGIYTEEESRLEGIAISLYKMSDSIETYDENVPSSFVKDNDELVGLTTTGENGNYSFNGLSSGRYYVSYTIDNNRYIITDPNKQDDNIPNSRNNNSRALLLPNTNKAISIPIVFGEENENLVANNINLGLTIKKEMAISLNKYITEVTVSRNGQVDTYDYSNQNQSQVSITVLNPKDTKIKVKYAFSIENTKYYPGYVGLIVDNMPPQMTFNPDIKENRNWTMYDGLLYYNGLSGKLLLPNEKQYFTLLLDLDLKEAGTYRNVVSARDLTLMGDALPIYDFGTPDTESANNTEGDE